MAIRNEKIKITISAKDKASGILSGIQGKVVAIGAAYLGWRAAANVMRDIISIGADFEHTMATVGGVMRATSGEMDKLTAVAKRMGETTEFTASQSGKALQFLGMAGFQAADAIKALPGVLDLATAGNLDLGRSADIASNALTAMSLPVEELTRVNDVFIGTITRSNVNMEMMAESFKFAAPIAKAYGYSIEELSGLIGKLGDAGIQGSMAGTALARSIKDAADIAKEMGMESSELVDVLQQLRASGEDTITIMSRFEDRAAKAIGALVDRLPEVRELQRTLTGVGGEAARLAEIMRATVKGSFAELKSVIESVAIDAFGRFGDSINVIVKTMTKLVRAFKFLTAEMTVIKSDVVILAEHIKELEAQASSTTATWSEWKDATDKLNEELGKTSDLVVNITDDLIQFALAMTVIKPNIEIDIQKLEDLQVTFDDLSFIVKDATNVIIEGLDQASVAFRGLGKDAELTKKEIDALFAGTSETIKTKTLEEQLVIRDSQKHISAFSRDHYRELGMMVGDHVERTRGAFAWLTEERRKELEKAAEQEAELYREVETIMSATSNRMANSVVNAMHGAQLDLQSVWRGIADDFMRLFVQEVLKIIAIKLIPEMLSLFAMFDRPANDRMAIQQGEHFAGFFTKGLINRLSDFNLGSQVAHLMPMSISGGRFALRGVSPNMGTTIQVNINAPVTTGQVEDWITRDMVPLIERASRLGMNNVQLEPFVTTGDMNVSIG